MRPILLHDITRVCDGKIPLDSARNRLAMLDRIEHGLGSQDAFFTRTVYTLLKKDDLVNTVDGEFPQ